MTHDDTLTDLNTLPPELAVDRAAEALAAAGQAAATLADRDGYDTATLTEAYNTLLPHTDDHPPSPLPDSTTLPDDPDRLSELLQAAAQALDRAASEPARIYALTYAANLAAQGRRACGNAKAGTWWTPASTTSSPWPGTASLARPSP